MTLGLLIGLSLTASADSLTGKVVKITDGDTLYVLDANYEQHKKIVWSFLARPTNATLGGGPP